MSIPSYTPGYPQNGSSLGASKSTIRNNLDGTFQTVGINHFNQNQANPGKHRFIQLPIGDVPPNATITPTGPSELLLFNGNLPSFLPAGIQNLCFNPPNSIVSGTTTIQLTRNEVPSASANGFSWMAGNILMQWGISTVPAGGTQLVTFPKSFKVVVGTPGANVFNIQVTGIRSNDGGDGIFVKTGSVTDTTFTLRNGSGSITSAYWMAIGQ
jgi:hypothetical protein